jgi:ATP-binding cassette subfamily B multidrug efflux pump
MFRFFENLVDPFAEAPHETPPKSYWAYLRTQMAPFRRIVPWLLISGLIVALMETGLIFYTGRIIDLMTASGAENFWSQHALEMTVLVIFILFLRPCFVTLQRLLLDQSVAGNMQDQVRWRAHKHMLGQSSTFFQNDFAGRLSNRVMQLGGAVESTTYMAFEAVWYCIAYIIGAALLMAQADVRLWVPLLIWLVIFVSYTYVTARRIAKYSEKWSNARSLVTGRIVDAYANIESVKLFADGKREEAYARNAMKRHRLRFMRFLRVMTGMMFWQTVINGILLVGVLGTAVYFWTAGSMTIGEVAAVSALVVRLNGMSAWIMWVTIELFEEAGTIKEGLESVAVAHAITDEPDAKTLHITQGEIVFENVTHHYGRDQGGLNGLNLVIKPGEKVGLVGRSGAGKSSLVNLMLRFFDAEQGRILIDGHNVSNVTQESLRAQIGMVTQDSSLLHRSVRANILYGRPDASEEAMITAAKRAEAHEFILDLEDPKGRRGYTAHVGERGVKLSGGQRQRIGIARVILKNAPILVLDEATSALDSEVEAAIQKTLYSVMEGKTVIAIAHRLSTIARMDRIIVLEDGKIFEEGTHDALLARNGLYAGFWARQSGGFLGLDKTG